MPSHPFSLHQHVTKQGSDDDVHSDDLLYESGEEEEESGGVDVLGAWEDDDN